MERLILATFNVNSIRTRLPLVLAWLEANRPDVLCLQETKVDDGRFPKEAFREAGYHVVCRGERQYNGVATLSLREPLFVSAGFSDGGPADEDRFLRTDFPGLMVLNTYVPQGRDTASPHFRYKLEWFGRFRRYLEGHLDPKEAIVWCGDLNVAREAIDVHDPKRLLGHVDLNPEVWEAYDGVVRWGFQDCFRLHHPGEEGQFTFFDYRVPRAVERRLGWRVDHILATETAARRCRRCWIDMGPRLGEKPSDHTVLAAEFTWEGA